MICQAGEQIKKQHWCNESNQPADMHIGRKLRGLGIASFLSNIQSFDNSGTTLGFKQLNSVDENEKKQLCVGVGTRSPENLCEELCNSLYSVFYICKEKSDVGQAL